MKMTFAILMMTLALTGTANSHAAASADIHHHHDHDSAEPGKLQLNAGKQWASDAALRQTMDHINQAMAKALPEMNKFSNDQYQALAATVNQEIAYAIKQCKLEPKSDAMLHLVIADMLAGAQVMEGKAPGARHDGAVQVLQALRQYGKYFQHPGWQATRG